MRYFPIFVMITIILMGCDNRNSSSSGNSHDITQTQSSDTVKAPANFGDFSFVPPDDWVSVPPDRKKTLVILLVGGSPRQDPEAMIKIDVGKPVEPSAEGTAKAFAASNQGKISPDTLDFDGEPGILVTTSSTSMQIPSHVVSIYRNGKIYLVMGVSNGKTSVSNALESIRTSWKWND